MVQENNCSANRTINRIKIMESLITLLLQILLRTEPCDIPDIQATCSQYRLDIRTTKVHIVDVCTAEYEGVKWEAVIEEGKIWELYEDDRPSFKKAQANGIWKNIYKGAITGIGKGEYCTIPKLNNNRHN